MKRMIVLLIGAVSLAGVLGEVAQAMEGKKDCPSVNFNIIGARKDLSDDWKAANEQDELGWNIDMRGEGWPISLDLWYLYATKKGNANEIITTGNVTTAYTDLERQSTTEEVSAGIKKIWTGGSGFSLFAAGGATWVKGTLVFKNVTNFDDSQVGWYGAAGVYYTVLKLINLGVFARYSDVSLTLGGRDLNAGGWHYGVLAGLHF